MIPPDFLRDLECLVEKHRNDGLALRVEKDADNDIIKLYGEKATPLARANDGLDDILELAHTVAEHHPLWSMLENSAEITGIALEGWHEELSESKVGDIAWHVQRLDGAVKRLGKSRRA